MGGCQEVQKIVQEYPHQFSSKCQFVVCPGPSLALTTARSCSTACTLDRSCGAFQVRLGQEQPIGRLVGVSLPGQWAIPLSTGYKKNGRRQSSFPRVDLA